MKSLLCVAIAASFLNGCATEWQTAQPVAPITYKVPAYRAERSVGNLRRLAILPVRVRRVGTFAVVTHSERLDASFVYKTADYLSKQKGYQVVPVVDHAGAWRPDVVLMGEFGSVDDIKTTWEQARSEEEIADAMKKIGRALSVDGVVSVWLEEYDYGSTLEGSAWGFLNLFLFNAPLLYALIHTNAEAVIYEVLSGQAVWRNQLSGDFERKMKTSIIDTFFLNLENAIPAQLAE